MAFWEKFKKTAGEVGEKLSDSGKKAVDKTKDLAEIAKLSLKVNEEEKKISDAFEKIGCEYVKQFAEDENRILPEVIDSVFEAKKKIAELEERIREIKGQKICTVCSAVFDDDSRFCPKCGKTTEEASEEAPVNEQE